MNHLVSIPREALAELLRASGSPLTPEQYLASLPELNTFSKYANRAKVSAWSRNLLIAAVAIGAVILPFSFNFEALVIFVGVATVAFFEFKVNRYFMERNPVAPSLGFRNQTFFAAGILIYGLYHAVATYQIPGEAMSLIEQNNLIDPDTLRMMIRAAYLTIGIVGGISQFALACYYWFARVKV